MKSIGCLTRSWGQQMFSFSVSRLFKRSISWLVTSFLRRSCLSGLLCWHSLDDKLQKVKVHFFDFGQHTRQAFRPIILTAVSFGYLHPIHNLPRKMAEIFSSCFMASVIPEKRKDRGSPYPPFFSFIQELRSKTTVFAAFCMCINGKFKRTPLQNVAAKIKIICA